MFATPFDCKVRKILAGHAMSETKKTLFESAAAHLKSSVALMVKNHIPPTPNHYSVWYSYSAKDRPELSKEINETIATSGGCSETKSLEMYSKHIAGRTEKELSELKNALEKMVCEVSSCLSDADRGTDSFESKMFKTFSKIAKASSGEMSIDETISAVREIADNSHDISHTIGIFKSQLKRANQEIEDLRGKLAEVQRTAITDPLTNLLNRGSFDRDFSALVETQRQFGLIIGDIDNFKNVNDTYGHQVGDMALRAVSRVFLDNARDGASAYRYGGEELVLLIPDADARVARQIADAMRRRIEKLTVMSRDSGVKLNSITASFGVSCFDGYKSADECFAEADKHLYEAKRLGRNRVMPMSM